MLGYGIIVFEGLGWGMYLLQVVVKLFENFMVIGYYKYLL